MAMSMATVFFDMVDVKIVKRIVRGKEEPESPAFRAADVNGDGKIDKVDIALFEDRLLKSLPEFPVEEDSCEPVNIMPLGDSITLGSGSEKANVYRENPYNRLENAGKNFVFVGYREHLYNKLENAGKNFVFVGSQMDGGFPQSRHEGHGGWTSKQLADETFRLLSENPAEIVLLHIGTNDLIRGYSGMEDVEKILAEIDRFDPATKVLLARIIIQEKYTDRVTSKFNDELENMANRRIRQGDDIVLMDMEYALDLSDYRDSLHPNELGYQKIATVWFETLNYILPTCN